MEAKKKRKERKYMLAYTWKWLKRTLFLNENHEILGKFYQPVTYISISSSNFLYIIAIIVNLKFFGDFNFCSSLSGNHKSLSTKLNPYPALYKKEWWLTEIELFPCSLKIISENVCNKMHTILSLIYWIQALTEWDKK